MTEKINVKVAKTPEDRFRLLSEEIVTWTIYKEFEIELENGESISITKYDDGDQVDWEFVGDTEQAKYDAMSEEDQDLFSDFVQGLTLSAKN